MRESQPEEERKIPAPLGRDEMETAPGVALAKTRDYKRDTGRLLNNQRSGGKAKVLAQEEGRTIQLGSKMGA